MGREIEVGVWGLEIGGWVGIRIEIEVEGWGARDWRGVS